MVVKIFLNAFENMENIFRKYEIQNSQGKKNEDLCEYKQEESNPNRGNENIVEKRNINNENLIKAGESQPKTSQFNEEIPTTHRNDDKNVDDSSNLSSDPEGIDVVGRPRGFLERLADGYDDKHFNNSDDSQVEYLGKNRDSNICIACQNIRNSLLKDWLIY